MSRYRRKCTECFGAGKFEIGNEYDYSVKVVSCKKCSGIGSLPQTKVEYELQILKDYTKALKEVQIL
jgi:hypothetical protein